MAALAIAALVEAGLGPDGGEVRLAQIPGADARLSRLEARPARQPAHRLPLDARRPRQAIEPLSHRLVGQVEGSVAGGEVARPARRRPFQHQRLGRGDPLLDGLDRRESFAVLCHVALSPGLGTQLGVGQEGGGGDAVIGLLPRRAGPVVEEGTLGLPAQQIVQADLAQGVGRVALQMRPHRPARDPPRVGDRLDEGRLCFLQGRDGGDRGQLLGMISEGGEARRQLGAERRVVELQFGVAHGGMGEAGMPPRRGAHLLHGAFRAAGLAGLARVLVQLPRHAGQIADQLAPRRRIAPRQAQRGLGPVPIVLLVAQFAQGGDLAPRLAAQPGHALGHLAAQLRQRGDGRVREQRLVQVVDLAPEGGGAAGVVLAALLGQPARGERQPGQGRMAFAHGEPRLRPRLLGRSVLLFRLVEVSAGLGPLVGQRGEEQILPHPPGAVAGLRQRANPRQHVLAHRRLFRQQSQPQ